MDGVPWTILVYAIVGFISILTLFRIKIGPSFRDILCCSCFHSITGPRVEREIFLPETCSCLLPEEFRSWTQLLSKLPYLNKTRSIVHAVESMPTIRQVEKKLGKLTIPQLRRAYVCLGQLAHSYLNGNLLDESEKATICAWRASATKPADDCNLATQSPQKIRRGADNRPVLPSSLAQPFAIVCRALGLPPVITAAIDLWNWRLKDPKLPFEFENLELISTMTGTTTETNFHLLPLCMHHAALGALPGILTYPDLVTAQRWTELQRVLQSLAAVLTRFAALIDQVYSLVDIDVFYDVYRPYLSGWSSDGVWLEGVAPHPPPSIALTAAAPTENSCRKEGHACTHAKGPSAGQSAMFFVFDAMLGVQGSKCPGQARSFQQEMLWYRCGTNTIRPPFSPCCGTNTIRHPFSYI